MKICLNGTYIDTFCTTLNCLQEKMGRQDDIRIVNGFSVSEEYILKNGDQVFLIPRGTMPKEAELEAMMSARHTPGVHDKVKKGRVGIAGLGGLGSHIAVMLARTGVGNLLLADFDVVEPSNLNRQNYMISHLGMKKTEAMKEQLAQINPYIHVETRDIKIDRKNAAGVFSGCAIICEAFDAPETKASFTTAVLGELPGVFLVGASGMAGYTSANRIRTERRMNRYYICGDQESEAAMGNGLMAPRVQVCAGHQANMVLRLLLNLEEE
jgi:sulfur carrier protein ThiS adenylyltransferase